MPNRSRKIIFRSLQEKDFVLLHAWFQMEHIKKWYCRDESFTLDMVVNKYKPRLNNPDIKSYLFYIEDQAVGYYQIYRVSKYLPDGCENYQHAVFKRFPVETLGGIDFFIGNTDFLYSGVGSKSLNQFIKSYCGNFKTLLSDPLCSNTYVINFLKKNGFSDFTSSTKHSNTNSLLYLDI